MPVDALDHLAEAWNLDANPFPAEANHVPKAPYSPTVFDEEANEFRRKLIRGPVLGRVNLGILWSQGAHADTGFGKTTLMREMSKEINRDLRSDQSGLTNGETGPSSRRLLQSEHPECLRPVPRALQCGYRPCRTNAEQRCRARPNVEATAAVSEH